MKRLLIGLFLFGWVLFLGGGVSAETPTATFVVDSVSDLPDDDVGDGICATEFGNCGLRAAIMEANSTTAHDTITFDFNSAVQISPYSTLPTITRRVTIDGTAGNPSGCPNVATPANLLITLSGWTAGEETDGLTFSENADFSIVRGLNIIEFRRGIWVGGADSMRIECNHIGTDNNNSTDVGNLHGIFISSNSTSTVVGGTFDNARTQRNVISGNDRGGGGILSFGDFTSVRGNYIGTTKQGTASLGNHVGIQVIGMNTTIGGNDVFRRNTISGNWVGIGMLEGAAVIRSNHIGVDYFGIGAIPNRTGIHFTCSSNSFTGVSVGSETAPNVIAFNDANGIDVKSCDSDTAEEITIRYNQIHSNGGLGIDLGDDGVTGNDAGDSDIGPNEFQNYPVVESAEVISSGGANATTRIEGFLTSSPNTTFDIDVYENDACDPSGFGEGQRYVDSFSVTTSGAGFVSYSYDLTLSNLGFNPPETGEFVTTTATDNEGNTSEFSACQEVANPSDLVVTTGQDGDDGKCDEEHCTLREAINDANALPAGQLPQITINPEVDYIAVEVALPTINRRVKLLGITGACPSASDFPAHVQIDYVDNDNNVDGLILGSGSTGSVIVGFSITNFTGNGIEIHGNNNAAFCNLIGVEPDGTSKGGNGLQGVLLNGDDNQVGASLYANYNVIGHNGVHGISLSSNADRNVIIGNHIGIALDGVTNLSNRNNGVNNAGDNTIIGNGSSDGRNVIAYNGQHGIWLGSGGDNTIQGNYIGVIGEGSAAGPNGEAGINIDGSSDNTIGGDGENEGNVISGNTLNGIAIYGTSSKNEIIGNQIGLGTDGDTPVANNHNAIYITGSGVTGTHIVDNTLAGNGRNGVLITNNSHGNKISRNAIYDNGEIGIDLDNNGVTPNDDGDGDGGTNRQMNFPELLIAADNVSIVGDFNSLSGPTYTLEFFHNPNCSETQGRYGQTYLGSHTVTLAGTNDFRFTAAFLRDVPVGDYIVATATHSAGDTSEFSACIEVTDAFIVNSTDDFSTSIGDGNCNSGIGNPVLVVRCSLRQAILEADSSGGVQNIYFAIEGTGIHTIMPDSSLPNIADRVRLDGSSYEILLNNSAIPVVEIDGANTSTGTVGLRFLAGSDGSHVNHLTIINFPSTGVLSTTDDNTFEFLGIGITSNAIVQGNGGTGISISGERNAILSSRVSNNGGNGVQVNSSQLTAPPTTIRDSQIAFNGNHGIFVTDSTNVIVSDNVTARNDGDGVRIEDSDLVAVGGFSNGSGAIANPGNTIFANDGHGISVFGDSEDIGIHGNKIGLNGNQPSGNGGDGIHFDSLGRAFVGFVAGSADDNIIAHSGGDGIRVMSPVGQNPTNSGDKAIFGNYIYDNGELGIDFGLDGPLGIAGLKKPNIVSSDSNGNVRVQLLNYTAGDYTLSVYNSDDCDPSGYGEGQRVVGSLDITIPPSGDLVVDFTGASQTVGTETTVVLVQEATRFSSEFSLCETVVEGVPTAVQVSEQSTASSGQSVSVVFSTLLLLMLLTTSMVYATRNR